jgi:hypothetical protein
MKIANTATAVRSEEMGRGGKKSKMIEVPRLTLRDKVNSKETDIEKLIDMRHSRKPGLPYNLKNVSVTV